MNHTRESLTYLLPGDIFAFPGSPVQYIVLRKDKKEIFYTEMVSKAPSVLHIVRRDTREVLRLPCPGEDQVYGKRTKKVIAPTVPLNSLELGSTVYLPGSTTAYTYSSTGELTHEVIEDLPVLTEKEYRAMVKSDFKEKMDSMKKGYKDKFMGRY